VNSFDQPLLSKRRIMIEKWVGISMLFLGTLLLALMPFFLDPNKAGVLQALAYTWIVIICMGVGTMVMGHYPYRKLTRAMLTALVLMVPWSFLLLLPLSNESKLWTLALVGSAIALGYSYFYRRRHFHPDKSQ
jgi:hypothetical protein